MAVEQDRNFKYLNHLYENEYVNLSKRWFNYLSRINENRLPEVFINYKSIIWNETEISQNKWEQGKRDGIPFKRVG